jgi:hypothetical protein
VLVINDDERPVVDVPPGEACQGPVEEFLCGDLDVRIEGGVDLRPDGSAPGQGEDVTDKMAGFNRPRRVVEHPGLGTDLFALPGCQLASLPHPVRKLLGRPSGSRSIAPQVHANGRAHEHGEGELFASRKGIEPAIEIKTRGLYDAAAAVGIRHLIQIETKYLRL